MTTLCCLKRKLYIFMALQFMKFTLFIYFIFIFFVFVQGCVSDFVVQL